MEKHHRTSQLKKLGIFTTSEAQKAGFSQPTLSRLAKHGEVIRLEHGIFRHKDAKINVEHIDFVVATKRFGVHAVVGLMSALAYHGLIEQVPEQVWLLVTPDVRPTSRLYRAIRVRSNLKMGIEHHKYFSITNIERTIVESFKYSTKVGLDVAVRAARNALKKRQTTASKVLKQAKELKMEQFILRHWEAITIE